MFLFGELHVFLQVNGIRIFGKNEPVSNLSPILLSRRILLSNQLRSHKETMSYMMLLLSLMCFFGEIHGVLQLSCIGILGTK
jgi:hypothetical protein